jgi:hypothetical protein
MKRVLLGRPDGSRLYELTDEEFARLEHLLGMVSPRARGAWTRRFLAERVPIAVYEPGTRGIPDEYRVDRAIGGNQFTPKWGQTTPRDPEDRTPE